MPAVSEKVGAEGVYLIWLSEIVAEPTGLTTEIAAFPKMLFEISARVFKPPATVMRPPVVRMVLPVIWTELSCATLTVMWRTLFPEITSFLELVIEMSPKVVPPVPSILLLLITAASVL